MQSAHALDFEFLFYVMLCHNAQRADLIELIIGAGQKSHSSAECIIPLPEHFRVYYHSFTEATCQRKKGKIWLCNVALIISSLMTEQWLHCLTGPCYLYADT